MKKSLLFLALIIGLTANAQLRKSQSTLADSIVMKQGAIEIEPVIVNAQGDTARSLDWTAFNLQREDTTAGCQTYVQLYDKNGRSIAQFNCPIPASVIAVWGIDPSPIDDYIFLMNPRFKRVVTKPTN